MDKLSPREEIIYRYVSRKGSASTEDLAALCEVTTASVRANLRRMAEEGLIIRTPGGAKIAGDYGLNAYTAFSLRMKENRCEKENIARRSLSFIEEGMTVFLDSSTTVVELARLLTASSKKISVITHSFDISYILQNAAHIKLYFCGGSVWAEEHCCVGDRVIQHCRSYAAHAAFLSPTAVHREHGCLNADEETNRIKQEIMDRSDRVWILADHHKFDKSAAFPMCEFSRIEKLVTSKMPGAGWEAVLRRANVELILA